MASKSMDSVIRRRRGDLGGDSEAGIEGVVEAMAEAGGAEVAGVEVIGNCGAVELGVEVEAVEPRTWASFQSKRPSCPPSTEMHSPEICPAA